MLCFSGGYWGVLQFFEFLANAVLLMRGAQRGSSAGGSSASSAQHGGSFANVSMMLRHCCNHPWLIDDVKEGALEALEAESSVRPPRTEREFSDPLYWHRQQQQIVEIERIIGR